MIPSLSESWPLRHEGADEWAGDEWLYVPGDHDNHLAYQGQLGREEHDRLDRRWFELYTDILRGDRPWDEPELQALTRSLSLLTALRHDRRRPVPAPLQLPDEQLADLVEDFVPDAGLTARDRMLGPFADEVIDLRLVMAAAASMAWLPLLDDQGSVSLRVRNRKPHMDLDFRRSFAAIGQAPPMLWDRAGQPLLPLGERWMPQGLQLPADAPSLGGPPTVWLGRAVPGPDGWWLACAIGLSEPPPLPQLQRRLELELLRLRRHERRASWEGLLRARVEVLYRTCASWIWQKEER